jgi:hypothetical protein
VCVQPVWMTIAYLTTCPSRGCGALSWQHTGDADADAPPSTEPKSDDIDKGATFAAPPTVRPVLAYILQRGMIEIDDRLAGVWCWLQRQDLEALQQEATGGHGAVGGDHATTCPFCRPRTEPRVQALKKKREESKARMTDLQVREPREASRP